MSYDARCVFRAAAIRLWCKIDKHVARSNMSLSATNKALCCEQVSNEVQLISTEVSESHFDSPASSNRKEGKSSAVTVRSLYQKKLRSHCSA
jgi:hypothetical protein